MTEPDPHRPGSAAHSPVPPSPRPSVASRASRSSLQRDRQEAQAAATSPSPQPPAEPTEPAFSPLFALLTTTQHPGQRLTTHHPIMHYVFADDDPEILADALNHHHRSPEEGDDDLEGGPPQDRALILDMAPDEDGGFEVAWASSLSPDWAVVDARVTPMEGDGGTTAGGRNSPPGTMMLRVEGVTIGPSSPSPTKTATPEGDVQSPGASGTRQPKKEDYTALIEDFEKRMGVLRRVIEAGEGRQRIPIDDEGGTNPLVTVAGPDVDVEVEESVRQSAE
ncbi:hypothetical protein GQ53DRAFT_467271 [Thozetella sp. PMI_491]|nr:hypothetical protein GQ53DRAFT_467271 [Thozetella sp. PMI_491]